MEAVGVDGTLDLESVVAVKVSGNKASAGAVDQSDVLIDSDLASADCQDPGILDVDSAVLAGSGSDEKILIDVEVLGEGGNCIAVENRCMRGLFCV